MAPGSQLSEDEAEAESNGVGGIAAGGSDESGVAEHAEGDGVGVSDFAFVERACDRLGEDAGFAESQSGSGEVSPGEGGDVASGPPWPPPGGADFATCAAERVADTSRVWTMTS